MPFRFDSANAVAVGTFNMYIVQPSWLAELGIIPKGIPVTISVKGDEPGLRFDSPKLPTIWVISPTRIEVSTKDYREDCGERLARVLHSLPWTPLKAVGTNAFFKAATNDPDVKVAGSCFDSFNPQCPEEYMIEQRGIAFGVKHEEHHLNMQLTILTDRVDLDANAHTEIDRTGVAGSELAQRAMRKFFDHRKKLEILIEQVFKVQVNYGEGTDSLPEPTSNGVADAGHG